MNEDMLDSLDRLSLNSLSKSSPSTFSLKTARLLQTPVPPLPITDKKSSNLSHVPCKFFKQGTCTAGSNCIFSHNLDPTSESSVCKYFRKGNCKFGTKCALLHTMSPFKTSTTTSSSISTSTAAINTPMYADPFALSAPSPSPFSILLLDESRRTTTNENDVDNFILPSSLNDLLTPTELRKQQVAPVRNNLDYLSSSTNSHHHTRQLSYEPILSSTPSSSSWNVPFYNDSQQKQQQQRYFSSNAINIPTRHSNSTGVYQHHLQFQHDFLPSNNSLFDEDSPFFMEDTTTCIDATFK